MLDMFRRARFSLEFAALTAVVCFALVAMKIYMTRAFQGKYRQLADEVGQQYDPQAAIINSTVNTHTITEEYMAYNGSDYVGTVVISNTDQDITSTETITN